MRWKLSVLILLPLLIQSKVNAAAELSTKPSVELKCSEKKVGKIPDWLPELKKYEGKELTVHLTRNGVTVEAKGVAKAIGKATGALPTDKYEVDAFGSKGSLALASAGALLGAKSSIVYLKAEGKKPNEPGSTGYTAELKCAPKEPGKIASFIKLCTANPDFKREVSCKTRADDTSGLPEKFTFKSTADGIEVNYVDPDEAKQTVSEEFKFISNDEPPMNSTTKLIEYCYFARGGKVIQYAFDSLRASRQLSETGKGFASSLQPQEDGAQSVPYDCAE